MKNNGHDGIKVSPAGFVIHLTKEWLGASPDGWVLYPLSSPQNGMIEINCPYSMANKTFEQISNDSDFYLNGECQLKELSITIKYNFNFL